MAPILSTGTMLHYGTTPGALTRTTVPPLPVIPMATLPISLGTAGRLGFYVDYSELSSSGTHAFYVCRTHGTAGSVSVSIESFGDSHQKVRGTLSWSAGDASIYRVDVPVTKSGNGEHRINVKLSAPTGGAVLHHGVNTVAYGVIDDGTIADDSDAVFYDSAAAGGGSGTQASPYNSIYDAIIAVNGGSKRYLYGKGTTTPDGTNTCNRGAGPANCIDAPAGRSSESDRLIIRNWPGSTWTVTGGAATDTTGFWSQGGIVSYHTYKGIDFSSLDASSVGSIECSGITYLGGTKSFIDVEYCTFDDINASTNTAGFYSEDIDTSKVWRSTFNNVQVNGDNTNGNSSGVLTYRDKNLSVQRCVTTNCGSGFFQKQAPAITDASLSSRFNLVKDCVRGIYWSVQSGADPAHNATIAQGNVIKDCNDGLFHGIAFTALEEGKQHWWCNNVFDTISPTNGLRGGAYFNQAFSAQIFNNIMYDTRTVWYEGTNSSLQAAGVEYADYNQDFPVTTGGNYRYSWQAVTYNDAAGLQAASTFADNDATGDPIFTDRSSDDYTLDTGSPCIGTGVGGNDRGVYLTGIEVVGA